MRFFVKLYKIYKNLLPQPFFRTLLRNLQFYANPSASTGWGFYKIYKICLFLLTSRFLSTHCEICAIFRWMQSARGKRPSYLKNTFWKFRALKELSKQKTNQSNIRNLVRAFVENAGFVSPSQDIRTVQESTDNVFSRDDLAFSLRDHPYYTAIRVNRRRSSCVVTFLLIPSSL